VYRINRSRRKKEEEEEKERKERDENKDCSRRRSVLVSSSFSPPLSARDVIGHNTLICA
jgi:hypothetical protein